MEREVSVNEKIGAYQPTDCKRVYDFHPLASWHSRKLIGNYKLCNENMLYAMSTNENHYRNQFKLSLHILYEKNGSFQRIPMELNNLDMRYCSNW